MSRSLFFLGIIFFAQLLQAQQTLIDELEGVLFVSSITDVEEEGIVGSDLQPLENYKTINFSGIYPPESNDLRDELIPFLGNPVVAEDLTTIKRIVEKHYIKHGFPYMSIAVPVQAVRHNLLQVVILDGRLGELKVEGNQWFRPENLKKYFSTKNGESINKNTVIKEVERMNKNPFRSVEVIFEEGEEEGETDVILKVQDKLPVKVSVSTTDAGNKLTDYNRISASVLWGNALWMDHILNYQISGDPGFDLLESHNINYTIPFAIGSSLSLRANWAENGADFPDPSLAISGESYGFGFTYAQPLPSIHKVQHELSGGFDFKRSNNSLAFNQIRVSDTTTDVVQFALDYSAFLVDETGYWSATLGGVISPGDLSEHNNATDLLSSGASDDSYEYLKGTISRMQMLPYKFSNTTTFNYQLANQNLPGSEKIGAGGSTGLIGYDEREANGDRGFSITTEFLSPSVNLAKYLKMPFKDDLKFRLFLGYADVSTKFKTTNTTNPNISLLSFGPGFRYSFEDYLQANFDYGIQLKDTGSSSVTRDPENHRAHFSLGVNW